MKNTYKFFDFTLNTSARKISLQDEEIEISAKAFDILLYLVENQGKVVLKNELFEAIWANSFVEENNLPVHISALRRVLGDKPGESRFIKTISGRGYTFIAPVSVQKPKEENLLVAGKTDLKKVSSSTAIAVLPFAFEDKNHELEYLSNGITQSLIDSLSQIANLKVMSYSAVKKHRQSSLDLSEIGFQLGVDKILTGSLIERAGELHLSSELINVSDESHIWGSRESFQLGDVFEVEKKISILVAEKLKLRINQIDESKLTHRQPHSTEALQLYLKGQYILENYQTRENFQESLNSALGFFHQSLKQDPNFAPAYVGSGRVYFLLFNDSFLNLRDARAKCQTALKLAFNADNNLSEAYALEGAIQIFLERDWQKANTALAQAIKLNPNNAYAYHCVSTMHAGLGRFEEAIFYQTQALRFDPTSVLLNSGLINRFYLAGNFRQSIVLAEESLELDPRSVSALSLMALSFAELGMFDEALSNSEKAIDRQPLKELHFMKAYIHASIGNTDEAREILERFLTDKTDSRRYDFSDPAAVYAVLDEKEKAYEYLEKAYLEGSASLTFFNVDPRFKKLREDKRYSSFAEKLNLS